MLFLAVEKSNTQMKKLLVTLILSAFCSILSNAQPRHVRWTYESKAIAENLFQISITAEPDPGWHVYDTLKTDFGPTATSVSFDTSGGVETVGELEISGKLHKSYDDAYMMEVGYFEGPVTFVQKLRLPSSVNSVKADVEWMSCNDINCDRPSQETMEITVR